MSAQDSSDKAASLRSIILAQAADMNEAADACIATMEGLRERGNDSEADALAQDFLNDTSGFGIQSLASKLKMTEHITDRMIKLYERGAADTAILVADSLVTQHEDLLICNERFYKALAVILDHISEPVREESFVLALVNALRRFYGGGLEFQPRLH